MDRAEKILNNKVAIITGSSSGIGAGIAYEFCRLGALVTITGRDEEQLKAVFTKCREILPHPTKDPLVIQGDITKEEVRKKIINDTVRYYGKLDILVNNAGYFLSNHLYETTTFTYLDAMLDIHVRVPFHMTKLAIPELIKTKGNVINVSSVTSFRPIVPKGAEYGIAKAAMDQLTRWTAFELGEYGIRANSVKLGRYADNKILSHSHALERYSHFCDRKDSVKENSRLPCISSKLDLIKKIKKCFQTLYKIIQNSTKENNLSIMSKSL